MNLTLTLTGRVFSFNSWRNRSLVCTRLHRVYDRIIGRPDIDIILKANSATASLELRHLSIYVANTRILGTCGRTWLVQRPFGVVRVHGERGRIITKVNLVNIVHGISGVTVGRHCAHSVAPRFHEQVRLKVFGHKLRVQVIVKVGGLVERDELIVAQSIECFHIRVGTELVSFAFIHPAKGRVQGEHGVGYERVVDLREGEQKLFAYLLQRVHAQRHAYHRLTVF